MRQKYLNDSLINLDVETCTVVECKIGHGSGDLVNVFGREGIPASNDTSFGVGFAPFSETESMVLAIEELLNSKIQEKYPQVGEDIKVMGLRDHDKITLTVAVAMISKHVDCVETYMDIKKSLMIL